jgi:hypothetical protein
MLKSALLIVLGLFLFGVNGYAQSDYQDEKLMISSDVLKHEDPTNDRFYEFYGFTLKNLSNENIKFEIVINYSQSGANTDSRKGDLQRIFTLAPGESISGQNVQDEKLTLFKAFLPGNSGVKAADTSTEIKSIEVNYL